MGLVAESLGDAVRDKAVAVLALALTSPSELTPQEAALAVEAAVFAHFAEQGQPALRSAFPVTVAQLVAVLKQGHQAACLVGVILLVVVLVHH